MKQYKATRDELEQQVRQQSQELDLYRMAYADACAGRAPLAIVKMNFDGGSYKFKLYGIERPCGGYVVITFSYPNQADQTDIVYLDRWANNCARSHLSLDYRIAAERLMIARSQAWQATQGGAA